MQRFLAKPQPLAEPQQPPPMTLQHALCAADTGLRGLRQTKHDRIL
jgi:hypothetical protein